MSRSRKSRSDEELRRHITEQVLGHSERVVPWGLIDPPRWTQTCPNGHYSRVRAEQRPKTCLECGAVYEIRDDSRVGGKRTSGAAALHALGDGRPRNRGRA